MTVLFAGPRASKFPAEHVGCGPDEAAIGDVPTAAQYLHRGRPHTHGRLPEMTTPPWWQQPRRAVVQEHWESRAPSWHGLR